MNVKHLTHYIVSEVKSMINILVQTYTMSYHYLKVNPYCGDGTHFFSGVLCTQKQNKYTCHFPLTLKSPDDYL